MAQLTATQRALADKMISGSFDAVGAPPAYIMPPQSVEDMYRGILPASPTSPRPVALASPPTGGQSRGRPLLAREPRLPSDPRTGYGYGTGVSPDSVTGGYTLDPRTNSFAYVEPKTTPAANAAATLANGAPGVPLPRPRPPNAPTAMDVAAGMPPQGPLGADPGMGGAMIGNGKLSPQIAPQQPPADGSSPLPVWKGDSAPRNPAVSSVLAGRTQSPNGYIYAAPGQKVGKVGWAAGLTPEQQYAGANLIGKVNAEARGQVARSMGALTPVQTIQRQTGMSAADAYAAANAAAAARARANASSPSHQSSNDWFSSVTS